MIIRQQAKSLPVLEEPVKSSKMRYSVIERQNGYFIFDEKKKRLYPTEKYDTRMEASRDAEYLDMLDKLNKED